MVNAFLLLFIVEKYDQANHKNVMCQKALLLWGAWKEYVGADMTQPTYVDWVGRRWACVLLRLVLARKNGDVVVERARVAVHCDAEWRELVLDLASFVRSAPEQYLDNPVVVPVVVGIRHEPPR